MRQMLILSPAIYTGVAELTNGTFLVLSERLRSVLEDLHSLSAAVVNSSEDSAEEGEEEEEEDRMTARDHPQAVHT